VRFQTAAFDVKRNQQLCLSYWYDCSLGHTFPGTRLGTLGAFLGFVCQKPEGKRGKATVFQTAAFVETSAPLSTAARLDSQPATLFSDGCTNRLRTVNWDPYAEIEHALNMAALGPRGRTLLGLDGDGVAVIVRRAWPISRMRERSSWPV
jgi:hypothetical protein